MSATMLEKVLRRPAYALLALIAAIGLLGAYVYTQVLGNLANVGVWMANVPFWHAFLLAAFLVLFGITFAYQVFLWRAPKVCPPGKKVAGTGASGVGTLAIFLVAQCPACASLGALFLPVSAIGLLTEYAVWLNLLSIALLLFTLNYLGALKRG